MSHAVQHATYPLPQPLALLLKASIVQQQESSREDRTTALTQLLSNALEAVDRLYFATSPQHRSSDWFAHRTCLRISLADRKLSITDLGTGMTRADLINSLGIGRLSKRAHHVARTRLTPCPPDTSGTLEENGNNENDAEDIDEAAAPKGAEMLEAEGDREEDEDGNTVDTDEEEETEDDDDDALLSDDATDDALETDDDDMALPCLESDIGGFYAALCALGGGVTIGTKSKFDDYYEFSYGKTPTETNYEQFTIRRPMSEGTVPTAGNGYDQFRDVRGESGTRVTIHCVDSDWCTEEVIRPMVTKILETSPYTVAFSTDSDAKTIIEASKQEREERAKIEAAGTNQNDADEDLLENGSTSRVANKATVKDRAKYIPLRLTLGERKMLRLVEAAMACCDYTSAVDSPITSARRTHAQLQGITSILRGLVSACDYEAGQRLATNEDELDSYQAFFQKMFEIARRHKIMNPEKMRTEYGKLVYLLQDAVSPTVQPHLGCSIKGKIVTVYDFLKERGGAAMLEDRLIEVATEEITGRKQTRAQTRSAISRKEKAVATLKNKYRTPRLSQEDIHMALYSICDNNSFLNSDRVPIDRIIEFLTTHFSPSQVKEGYSLDISEGQNGARLSHSHERQYYFALQSLSLWRDIVDDMFRLWQMAEEDLLSETVTYSLQDTGQGLQRVQQSPRTYKAMQQILLTVQQKVHQWIGSSVIHMGDHNVPNALSFIDKYTQVPRILGPIVTCLEVLEKLYDDNNDITELVDSGFGGLEKLRMDILIDFFRSAFDGSGADNFYDAGSCIDGRLTSAWNWCSQLPTKPYYCIFKLTGFIGFDGDFK